MKLSDFIILQTASRGIHLDALKSLMRTLLLSASVRIASKDLQLSYGTVLGILKSIGKLGWKHYRSFWVPALTPVIIDTPHHWPANSPDLSPMDFKFWRQASIISGKQKLKPLETWNVTWNHAKKIWGRRRFARWLGVLKTAFLLVWLLVVEIWAPNVNILINVKCPLFSLIWDLVCPSIIHLTCLMIIRSCDTSFGSHGRKCRYVRVSLPNNQVYNK